MKTADAGQPAADKEDPPTPEDRALNLDQKLIKAIEDGLEEVNSLLNDVVREDPHLWERSPRKLERILAIINRQMTRSLKARDKLSKIMLKEYLTATARQHEIARGNIDIVQEAADIIRKNKKKTSSTPSEAPDPQRPQAAQ
jgi:hypothetical protein